MGLFQRAADRTRAAISQARTDIKIAAIESRERQKEEKAIYDKAYQAEKAKLTRINKKKRTLTIEERAKRKARGQFGRKKTLKIGMGTGTPAFKF